MHRPVQLDTMRRMGTFVRSAIALLAVWTVCGCSGAITSDTPLLVMRSASFPLPRHAEVEGSTLQADVWQREAGKGRIDLVDGAYRVTGPDSSEPSPDRFLFKQVSGNELIVQARNDDAWAYGLIVREDRYYLFTFNRSEQTCTELSAEEQRALHMVVRDQRCYVRNLTDLVGLLRFMRKRFPHPTSAFTIIEVR